MVQYVQGCHHLVLYVNILSHPIVEIDDTFDINLSETGMTTPAGCLLPDEVGQYYLELVHVFISNLQTAHNITSCLMQVPVMRQINL